MANPIQNNAIQQLITQRPQPANAPNAANRTDFSKVLNDRLKISGHAQTRLDSREIKLDSEAWERVMQGVDKAAAKGAKESLVMVDDVALIVSVKNRTVITAVEQSQLKENVFTNIDSAVIV